MSTFQYILGILAALFTFGLVVELLRRRRLRERHAGWWLIAGLVAIVVSIFPKLLSSVAEILGFEVPINLAFFASLIILFLVALQHSSELTKLESHNRTLVERLIILELKLDLLDKNTKEK